MEQTAPSVGARVELHSLQQKPEHNGVEGEVLEFDASAGRWKVQLHPDGLLLALKASNLAVLAPAESDSSNATLCNNCSKVLQKPLVCARCKTATYCSKDCQVHYAYRKRGGIAIKAVIGYSNAHTNTNVTE
jgi:hypothetical protein